VCVRGEYKLAEVNVTLCTLYFLFIPYKGYFDKTSHPPSFRKISGCIRIKFKLKVNYRYGGLCLQFFLAKDIYAVVGPMMGLWSGP
jgi:hypothetical protein